jgi:hypothetical protein
MTIDDKYLQGFYKSRDAWVSIGVQQAALESTFAEVQGRPAAKQSEQEIRALLRRLNREEAQLYRKMRKQLFRAYNQYVSEAICARQDGQP